MNARPSDEDAGGQDICRVAARRSEARQTGGAPQLVDISGYVKNCRQESLRKAGTQAGSEENHKYGTGH